MRLFVRVVLLLATVKFASQALIGYAFDFRTHGYPLWPLLGLGLSFFGYLKLRPPAGHHRKPEPSAPAGTAVDHAFLLLILAVVSSAFLLDKRGEDPFTAVYFLHLSTLTLFQLLLPFIVAYSFQRGRSFVNAVATLVLLFFLVDGTMKDPQPVIEYFTEARAYSPHPSSPDLGRAPIPLLPPNPPNPPVSSPQ